jgi:hypothetical protein
MFVLISPVQSYKWEDTGRIAPGSGPQRPQPSAMCVLSGSESETRPRKNPSSNPLTLRCE